MISRARPKYQDLYDGERAMSGILQLAKHLNSIKLFSMDTKHNYKANICLEPVIISSLLIT